MNEIYLMHTNGYTAVAVRFSDTGRWYIDVCAPTGYFGEVDILSGDDDSVIAALAEQAADYFPDEADLDYCYIDSYDGMSAAEIERVESETVMVFVCIG